MRSLALTFLSFVLVSGVGVTNAQARSHHHHKHADDETQPSSGSFDYYLFTLSWSPTFCATNGDRSPEQCAAGHHFGFVVHGLWPQYNNGGYPESCSGPRDVPAGIVRKMLPLMPSEDLVTHEWQKHGRCSQLDVAGYFHTIESAYGKVQIPQVLRSPERPVTTSLAELERMFLKANPDMPADTITVQCKGQYVSEVRICFDRKLGYRSCGRGVRDHCGGGKLVFRPLR